MFRSLLLLPGIVLVASACRGETATETVPRDTFVAVNVALRLIPDTVADPDSARHAVLEEHGVTADELHEYAAARRGDLEGLAAAWREVATRLDSIQRPADPEEIAVDGVDHADTLQKPVDRPGVRLPSEMELSHPEPPRRDPPMRGAPPVRPAGEVPLPRPPAPMIVEEPDSAPPPPKSP